MLGQHVLGAEGTDIHHPRPWLLGCSLLGHCELCIGDTASCALETLPSRERWGQISELPQCSAMGLLWASVRGPAFFQKTEDSGISLARKHPRLEQKTEQVAGGSLTSVPLPEPQDLPS